MTDAEAIAHVLCDSRELLARDGKGADGGDAARDGVLWKITEPGRQLDANLVRLAPDARVAHHAEPDLDVLLIVAEGGGALETPDTADQTLTAGTIVWLPHGSARSLRAGGDGLAYFTVHRRRPGMQIRTPPIRPL
jgi:quercetin dioxygenase-like cupin family protein